MIDSWRLADGFQQDKLPGTNSWIPKVARTRAALRGFKVVSGSGYVDVTIAREKRVSLNPVIPIIIRISRSHSPNIDHVPLLNLTLFAGSNITLECASILFNLSFNNSHYLYFIALIEFSLILQHYIGSESGRPLRNFQHILTRDTPSIGISCYRDEIGCIFYHTRAWNLTHDCLPVSTAHVP